MISLNDIEASHKEYLALSETEWRKDYFDENTGGYVATHRLKAKDTVNRNGIAKEVSACKELAKIGKRILRLPENVLDKIDVILIGGVIYRKLLKFKAASQKPRGYPDVYFDRETWDFKTSTFKNEESLRQTVKEGRKASNLIFIINEATDVIMIEQAIRSETGRRKKDESWHELPDIYCWFHGKLTLIWGK